MSAVEESLIAYLRGKAKNSLMTPAQLAEEIPISAKQQSVLRQNGTFPIPHKKIGSKVYYSIFHVAEFLLNGETSDAPIIVKDEAPEAIIPKKKRVLQRGNLVDKSHLFNLRSFVAHIQQEAENITALANLMHKYEQSLSLKQKLESELQINDIPEEKTAI